MSADLIDELRQILRDKGRLSVDPATLGPDDELYAAGLTSHSSVKVMLATEDAFDIEFPEEMLTGALFATMGSIAAAVRDLRDAEAA